MADRSHRPDHHSSVKLGFEYVKQVEVPDEVPGFEPPPRDEATGRVFADEF